jgi:hypothetical protein
MNSLIQHKEGTLVDSTRILESNIQKTSIIVKTVNTFDIVITST